MQPIRPGEPGRRQHGRAPCPWCRLRRVDLRDLAPDHHLDDLVRRARALGEGLDVAGAAEDRAGVGQRLDLVHPVRDEEDRDALVPQASQDLIDGLHVRRGQRRGRLVQDQEPRAAAERLGELDELAPGQRQVADRLSRIDVLAMDEGQQLLGAPTLEGAVDEAPPARGGGDADILLDGQVGDERQLLEDRDDAALHGVAGTAQAGPLAVEEDLPDVGPDDAADHLDQGALAGTVLAEDRVDRVLPGLEVDLVQRHDAAEGLRDAAQTEKRCLRRLVAAPGDRRPCRRGGRRRCRRRKCRHRHDPFRPLRYCRASASGGPSAE